MAGTCASPLDQIRPEKAFILMFKTLPVLWDPTNPHYTNKYKRMEALTKLLPYLKRSRPDATTYDVRKKINSLRSNYRRELRKIIMSQSGDNSEVYNPKGWSFRYLTFLGTLEEPGQEYKLPNETSDEEELEEIVISQDESLEFHPETSCSPVSISPPPPPPPPKVRKKIKRESVPIAMKYDYVPGSQDYSPMVLEWVNTLDRLDPMQRLYAKKAINDILFEAELGNLTRYSVKINEGNDQVNSSPTHSSLN